MNLFMSAVIGGCVGYVAYGVLFCFFDTVSGWWDQYDDRKRKIVWRVRAAFLVVSVALGLWFCPGWIETLEQKAEAKHAAYLASLRSVTVTVVDVEPVYHPAVAQVTASMVVTEEFPGQKMLVPAQFVKTITVGDMLDLKLDGWEVIQAAPAETMPIPHGK